MRRPNVLFRHADSDLHHYVRLLSFSGAPTLGKNRLCSCTGLFPAAQPFSAVNAHPRHVRLPLERYGPTHAHPQANAQVNRAVWRSNGKQPCTHRHPMEPGMATRRPARPVHEPALNARHEGKWRRHVEHQHCAAIVLPWMEHPLPPHRRAGRQEDFGAIPQKSAGLSPLPRETGIRSSRRRHAARCRQRNRR